MNKEEQLVDTFEKGLDLADSTGVDFIHKLNGKTKKVLYHYTDINGLVGILQSNTIWLNNILFQNDSREYIHATDISTDVCDELIYEYEQSTEELKAALAEAARDMFCEDIGSNIFIGCFAKSGDQLSQWRAYGQNGSGFSIGFDLSKMESKECAALVTQHVNYDTKNQKQFLKRYISTYIDYLSSHIKTNAISVEDAVEGMLYVVVSCNIFGVSFKNEGFKEEQEVRVFIDGRDADCSTKFRRSGNRIVPYIEFKSNAKLPIKEIYIGPTSDAELMEISLQMLLERYNYDNVEIKFSEIPYRA